MSMSSPSPSRLEAVQPKHTINPRDGLRSALRMWLLYRDQAVWCLVSGVGSDTGDPVLDKIDLSTAQSPVDRMNVMREEAYTWAGQIDSKHAESVLRAGLEELLADESPRFLLRVPESPGAF